MPENILDIKSEQAELQLKHPNGGRPLDAYLLVVGYDSAEFHRLLKNQKMDTFIWEPEYLDLLINCVKGWHPDESFNGPFSKDALKKFLTPERSWALEQLNSFIKVRENFIQRDTQDASIA